jgi:hypothetical protein
MNTLKSIWYSTKELIWPSVNTRLLIIQDIIEKAMSELKSTDLVYYTKNEIEDKAPSTCCGELAFKWLTIGVLKALQKKHNFEYISEMEVGHKPLFEDIHLIFDRKTHVVLELKYVPLRFASRKYSVVGNKYEIERLKYPIYASDWLSQKTDITNTYFSVYGIESISAEDYLDQTLEVSKKYMIYERHGTILWCLIGVGNRCFGKTKQY